MELGMTSEYVERKAPEDRRKRERPEWLIRLDEIIPCKACGLIAGGCLYENIGKECMREK